MQRRQALVHTQHVPGPGDSLVAALCGMPTIPGAPHLPMDAPSPRTRAATVTLHKQLVPANRCVGALVSFAFARAHLRTVSRKACDGPRLAGQEAADTTAAARARTGKTVALATRAHRLARSVAQPCQTSSAPPFRAAAARAPAPGCAAAPASAVAAAREPRGDMTVACLSTQLCQTICVQCYPINTMSLVNVYCEVKS